MIIRLTEDQSKRVHKLVRKRCSNCIRDNCLLLDDGEEHTCVQLISRYGIYCKYFLSAVLPNDKELYEEILNQNQKKERKCKIMKNLNETKIIGIDHGYGNIKTANHCFKTGIMGYDSEPLFTKDMLIFDGRYYLIGEGHKEFRAEKSQDMDYYYLTLAAIAMELSDRNITSADVIIAAGLPLTWTSGQKAEFRNYLLQKKKVSFNFRKVDYEINIIDVKIFPQGYSAIAPITSTLKGLSMVADIGNGTMNTLYLVDGRPQSGKMFTEKFGTYQCTLAVREEFMRVTRRELNDYIIDEVICKGTADIPDNDLNIIKTTAALYVEDIFRRLREHGYDENTMKLIVTGGGGCLIKHFGNINPDRVIFVDDICAAAKGYEYIAEAMLKADDRNG